MTLPNALIAILDELEQDTGLTKTAIIRKSISLIKIVVEEKKRGSLFVILDKDQQITKEIVDLV